MQNSDAQKSEIHEVTDDASTSPASNAASGISPAHVAGGDIWPARAVERAPGRTNVAGITVVEADDLVDAPPGKVELHANLEADKTFYPTDAANLKDLIPPGHDIEDPGDPDFHPYTLPFPGYVDPTTQNLSP